MNERLTIQDLIDLLAAKHSMTKKDAEAFVKEFFLLIEQALENEKTVKIKGLGTFKLVDVDSRESVNVNTGERFQIKGHTKVSFTPDTNLRDTINKPFAHFETVVLNEGTVLEDTPMEESDEEEGAVSDTETEMIDSEIAGNENAGGDIQEEIQLEEPVIEEQPTAEAVAVAEVPETDANETGQPETEPSGTGHSRHGGHGAGADHRLRAGLGVLPHGHVGAPGRAHAGAVCTQKRRGAAVRQPSLRPLRQCGRAPERV